MEAFAEYITIIANRRKNPLPKDANGAKHHIFPKSLGGSNRPSNIVKLTRGEHYRCHELLPTIFKQLGDENGYHKMLYAWHFIHTASDGTEVTQQEYEMLLDSYDKMVRGKPSGSSGKHWSMESRMKASESHKGKSPSNKGVPHTEESKRKMSLSHKGRKTGPVPEERRKKISDSLKGNVPWNKGKKGVPHTEEQRKRQSADMKVRKWYHDDKRSYFLKVDDPRIEQFQLTLGRH